MPLIQRPGDDRIDYVDGHTGAVVASIASDGTIYSDKGVQPFPAPVKAEVHAPRPRPAPPVVEPAPAPAPTRAPVVEPVPAPVVEPVVPAPAPVEPAPVPAVEPVASAADLPSLAAQVAAIATALKAKGIL